MTFYLSLCRKGLFTYSPPFLPKYSLPPKSVGYFNGTHPHSGRLPLTGRYFLIGWLVVSLRKFSLLFSVCHWCGGLGWRKSLVWPWWRKSPGHCARGNKRGGWKMCIKHVIEMQGSYNCWCLYEVKGVYKREVDWPGGASPSPGTGQVSAFNVPSPFTRAWDLL